MEYLSVEQYAKIHGVHPRTVQRRCQAGLIPGAYKLGNNWLIPSCPEKTKSQAQGADSISPSLDYLTFASGRADEHLQSLPKNGAYQLVQGLFFYYRCQYIEALCTFDQIGPTEADYLAARLFSLYASISLGDFSRYRSIMPIFASSQDWESRIPGMGRVVECFQANIKVSVSVDHNMPEWLKNGDLSSLPPTMRDLSWYTYIKYLQTVKDYRVMLVAAEARISTQKPGLYSLSDIYAYIYAALGHLKQDNLVLARRRMMTVMDLALADGFIGPFVETLTILQGLTERCLMEAFSQYYEAVINQWKRVFPYWIKAHNELAAHIIPEILTLREHQVALYAVDGLTNEQIAQKLYISLSTVKKDLSCIYDKLGITGRRQLKKLF